jgi:hypothetical protein
MNTKLQTQIIQDHLKHDLAKREEYSGPDILKVYG